MALVLLTAVAMALIYGIGVLEKGHATHAWMSRHSATLDLLKGILFVLAVPGAFIIQVWMPGMNSENLTKPGPRWFLAVIVGLFIAFLLYFALKIYLAGL